MVARGKPASDDHSARASGGLASGLAGLVLGPALQLQQAELWPAWANAGLLLAGLLLFAAPWLARPRLAGLQAALLLAGAACAAAGVTGLRAEARLQARLPSALEGRDLQLTGVVAAMPQRSDAGVRFRFRVEAALAPGQPVPVPQDLLLGWYGGPEAAAAGRVDLQRTPPDLRPGQRWQLVARLKAPHGHVNPHGFDYELWLWEQGLQATGYVRAGPREAPTLLAQTWRHPVERARHAVRDALFAHVPDARLAGVLAALVVGDQGAIDRADWDVFRATGVAHLMSISGLHVTMFAWLAAGLIGAAWRRVPGLMLRWPAPHAALVGGALCAGAYALFAGWGVPAQRTVCMLATVALLRLAGRGWPWPAIWLAAAAVVVTADPWSLAQAGFWLSFVAVGVLFATTRAEVPPERATRLARATRFLRQLVREQVVVTVALTPLSLLLFQQVSAVGLLANLVAIPWVTLVVTPLGLAGVLWAPLWTLGALAVDALGGLLQLLALLPGATWSSPAAPLWAGAAGVTGGLLLAMQGPLAWRLLGLPLLLPVLLWQAPRPAEGRFELLAADVGQGNAVIVRTAHHTLVYDTGPAYSRETDAGQRVLVPLLRAGGEAVAQVVLSHRDQDHTGGAAAVLRMQPQAGLLSSLEADHPLLRLRPGRACVAGSSWRWDGVHFEVLHPPAGEPPRGVRPNAVSCVLRISTAEGAALLAGDIEQPQEAALVRAGAPLEADFLLVPHHGSTTSSSTPFLVAVSPAVAVVQAGYRNRFGHPAPVVLQRLRDRGIQVVASAECGAAHWRSWAPGEVLCQRKLTPRYWHHRAKEG